MKNVITAVAVLLLSTALFAQGNGRPSFWGDQHPDDTHTHQNGNGHDGNENRGHRGWGFGHHKDRGRPQPPINPCDNEMFCPPPPCDPTPPSCPPPSSEEPECGGGAQPVPEPGTMLLLGTGLAGIAMRRRKKKATSETLAV